MKKLNLFTYFLFAFAFLLVGYTQPATAQLRTGTNLCDYNSGYSFTGNQIAVGRGGGCLDPENGFPMDYCATPGYIIEIQDNQSVCVAPPAPPAPTDPDPGDIPGGGVVEDRSLGACSNFPDRAKGLPGQDIDGTSFTCKNSFGIDVKMCAAGLIITDGTCTLVGVDPANFPGGNDTPAPNDDIFNDIFGAQGGGGQPATGCNPNSTEAINLGDCLILNEQQSVKDVYSTPSVILNTLVSNLFILAGIVFMFILLYTGFVFINQGQKGVEEAKQIITTAVIGFILMFAAYWIIQIIQLLTGINLGIS